MNARTLSGSIRSASVRRGRVVASLPPSPPPAPVSEPIRTETRNGVLYVVDRFGATPVASPEIAASYARALRGAGIT